MVCTVTRQFGTRRWQSKPPVWAVHLAVYLPPTMRQCLLCDDFTALTYKFASGVIFYYSGHSRCRAPTISPCRLQFQLPGQGYRLP